MSKSGYSPITNIYKQLNKEELKTCHTEIEALELELKNDPSNKIKLDNLIEKCIRFGDLELANKEPDEAKSFYEKAKAVISKDHFRYFYLNTKLLEAIEDCFIKSNPAPKK